jgi:hypothetical protein
MKSLSTLDLHFRPTSNNEECFAFSQHFCTNVVLPPISTLKLSALFFESNDLGALLHSIAASLQNLDLTLITFRDLSGWLGAQSALSETQDLRLLDINCLNAFDQNAGIHFVSDVHNLYVLDYTQFHWQHDGDQECPEDRACTITECIEHLEVCSKIGACWFEWCHVDSGDSCSCWGL